MKFRHYIYVGLAICALNACATQKTQAQVQLADTLKAQTTQAQELLERIYDNEAYQRNLVAKLTFTLQKSGSNVSVPGQLHMRRDEVIRLQLQIPFLGSEVGRLEFTPTEVLLVDRIHKQYCRANYENVSFLAENGISFYTLQALFWNKLTLPGQQAIDYSNLGQFAVSETDGQTSVSVDNGKFAFRWLASTETGLIGEADVTYTSQQHGTSSLTWIYDDFQAFGSKKFPCSQSIAVSTRATGKQKDLKVLLDLDAPTADSSWDATTSVSDRYTAVSVEELLSKLITL